MRYKDDEIVRVVDQESPFFGWVGKVRYDDGEICFVSVDASHANEIKFDGRFGWLATLLFGRLKYSAPQALTFRHDQLLSERMSCNVYPCPTCRNSHLVEHRRSA